VTGAPGIGAVEIREREGVPPLYGVLIQEGRAATRRREVFAPGSVQWPSGGVAVLTRHRGEPEVRAVPERQADGRITLRTRATDAIREAVAAGRRFMSVEFHALQERRTEGGIREILRALVPGVALVPNPEYDMTAAEVRGRGRFGTTIPTGQAIDCRCADGGASRVEFSRNAFRGAGDLDVTAISRGAESVLASTATDTLTLDGAAGGLRVSLSTLDTEAGRRTRELLEVGQPVYARPLWDEVRSEWELRGGGLAVVSAAWFKYLLVRPVPKADAGGLEALGREAEGRETARDTPRPFLGGFGWL